MAYEVITLNLIPSGEVPVIHAAQYDVNRPLMFALKLGSDDFNPSGYDLELQIRKVDNNIVTAAPASVTSNVVTFNSTEQMTACSGTNLGEIQITKDDMDIATLHFYLVVQRDVLAGGLTSQSEIHDLEEQIAEIVPEVIGDEYYTAEQVDEKIAEIPTFDPTNYYDKTQLYTKTETNGLLAQKANTSALAAVALSGSYNDLLNKPNIPDVSDYYTKSETYSQGEVNTLLSSKVDTTSLSAVATSGDYDDLLNKPTIPAAQVQSDWSQSDNTQVDYIKNKPTIPAAQVNADWNASSGVAEILNKPTIPTNAEQLPIESGSATNTKYYIDNLYSNIGVIQSITLGIALTTTATDYNTYNSRKFSDYDLIIIRFGASETDTRQTVVLPQSIWKSGQEINMGALHGSNVATPSSYSYSSVNVKYKSDTSITAIASGSAVLNTLFIYGIKLK